MAKKNREVQRIPPEYAQRAALRHRMKTSPIGERFFMRTSDNSEYGLLRVQIEHWQAADPLASVERGARPNRDILLRTLDVLEAYELPIRTGDRSPVVRLVAARINRSESTTRDLLHKLADMAERHVVGP